MQPAQLQALKEWFIRYVRVFYSDDPAVQDGIHLKEAHTGRVCEEMRLLGNSLHLEAADLNLAEAVALLHDVGRFKQYATYRTFNDRRSENHALLGIRELAGTGALSGLPAEEENLITKAVEYHNRRELPHPLPERQSLFARLIRDADKLDILYLFTESLARENQKPNRALNSALPNTPGYSPVLIHNLLQGRLCRYDDMKNYNDRKLLMLSWVYDINFPWTLAEINRRGYLEKILDGLPATGEIRQAGERLRAAVTRKTVRPAPGAGMTAGTGS
ncbi:HD domain-containing protein [Desulfotomaculum copahuensis]|uniref:Phosphohydrolase n=1 Tax=Desulfotomaculum copahuensis TaxID=1838280 RepID=A0A1B7LIG3_9FIRM|nr:HD domain-containing protein [Desulfotomaculum copahuensis]OAT86097.1 phosphohydrolase [Desulfotomaculum copahuensis]